MGTQLLSRISATAFTLHRLSSAVAGKLKTLATWPFTENGCGASSRIRNRAKTASSHQFYLTVQILFFLPGMSSSHPPLPSCHPGEQPIPFSPEPQGHGFWASITSPETSIIQTFRYWLSGAELCPPQIRMWKS